jgi:hypothetical protein
LADTGGESRLGHHRLAESGIGGRQEDRQHDRLGGIELIEEHRGEHGTQGDGQRQPDPEQAQGNRVLAPEHPRLDPRSVREQHDRQGRLGEHPHALSRRGGRHLVDHERSHQHPDNDEHHRRRDGRAGQPPRNCSDRQNGRGDDRQLPFHTVHSIGSPTRLGIPRMR